MRTIFPFSFTETVFDHLLPCCPKRVAPARTVKKYRSLADNIAAGLIQIWLDDFFIYNWFNDAADH